MVDKNTYACFGCCLLFLQFTIAQTFYLQENSQNIDGQELINAFNSSYDTIILERKANPWAFDPITISNVKNKVLILEKGAELQAKSGAFPEKTDVLFEFRNCENITIRGSDNKICMNKNEYLDGEWRHAFSLKKCKNFIIQNLNIYESGGDGIYISGMEKGTYSENIHIKNVLSDGNKRQGLSIISGRNIFIYNSSFINTIGTLPGSGVDIEPNKKWNRIENINFTNCVFEKNDHSGVLIALSKLDSTSYPISINFENCVIRTNHNKENKYVASEIVLSANKVSPVKGKVLFKDCLIEDSEWGFLYSRKVSDAYKVVFDNCEVKNISKSNTYPPILLEVPDYHKGSYNLGGYEFNNVSLSYTADTPVIVIRGSSLGTLKALTDVSGKIDVINRIDFKPIEFIKFDESNNQNYSLVITSPK